MKCGVHCCCYDDEVHPAHEIAHAFLRAGAGRGSLYVVCCKYYDDVDVRPAHEATDGRSQVETSRVPYHLFEKIVSNIVYPSPNRMKRNQPM